MKLIEIDNADFDSKILYLNNNTQEFELLFHVFVIFISLYNLIGFFKKM
jgi:hypothetical protein